MSAPFTSRQHMVARDFEVYNYRDAHLTEVALHHHDFFEIYLFVSGKVTYAVESRTYRMRPGDMLLLSPSELHQPLIDREEGVYERYVLWIDRAYLTSLSTPVTNLASCFDTARAGHTNLIRLSPENFDSVTQQLLALSRPEEDTRFGADIERKGLLTHFLVEINRLALSGRVPPQAPADPQIEQIIRYITAHLSDHLSIEEIASQFYFNKYTLLRTFKRAVGTSLYRYITQKRLLTARQKLATGASAADASRECGFQDYSSFYRAFRAEYGASPGQYAESAKQDFLSEE